MSAFDNTPKLSPPQLRQRRALVHATLFGAVQSALPASIPVYFSPPQGVIAWVKGDWFYCFQVNPYDQFAWRITNRWIHQHRLPERLRLQIKQDPDMPGAFYGCPFPEPKHRFELSFVGRETPLVATPELVRFVESVFTAEKEAEVYRWSLFAHDKSSYPHYAWTRAGGPEVERKQRARAKRESVEQGGIAQ